MTEKVTRIGVSLEPELLEAFDRQVDRVGYKSRSEALRDLVRESLVTEKRKGDEEVIGSLTVLYNIDEVKGEDFTSIQHKAQQDEDIDITATLHVHVDHRNCLEVIIIRGRAGALETFSDKLRSLKGIKQGHLTVTAVPPS
ncbi:MAG: nickel-responsive transcriptional regulator NikR [Candidatus Thermoplasmatota archaeon]|nr:nickel-responsive transcriptional regulator NikR [Candidatus Thermoplasmatota archaeon]